MKKRKKLLLLLILLLFFILGTIKSYAFKFNLNVGRPSLIETNIRFLINKINNTTTLIINKNDKITVENNINDNKYESSVSESPNNNSSSIIKSNTNVKVNNRMDINNKKDTSLITNLPNNINNESKEKNNDDESVLVLLSEFVIDKVKNDNNIDNSNSVNNLQKSDNSLLDTNSTNSTETIQIINNSIYCWQDYVLSSSNIDIVINRMKSLNITNAYILMDDIEVYKESISKLKENGISVYYLDGHSSWYKDIDSIKSAIDKVYDFNNNNPSLQLSGIVLDVEPYSRDEYKADVIAGFELYVDTMASSYSYAKEKNIKMTIAIPYWFDKYMTENKYTQSERERAEVAFEKLIKNSDRISVMNYYKKNMNSHIETEINYAKKYGKEIESIAEFSKTNSDISTKTTFYTDENPIESANAEWKTIKSTYDYDKLTFSYHHLSMILELYKEMNRIHFEFIDENSNVVSSGKYVVTLSNGEKIENSVTSDTYIEPNKNFEVLLRNYDISSYDGEIVLENGTIKRTYHVVSKEKYQLEIYADYSDNSKISDGTLKLINTDTLEEYTADCNETNGYFFFRKIYSDVPYKVVYVDVDGNKYSLHSATAKNNELVQTTISDNDNIIIPKGFKSSLYVIPKFIIEKPVEEPPESYLVELYPRLWNGKKYASVQEGKIKIINVSTQEEMVNTIMGNSTAGFYTYFNLSAKTNYNIRILDGEDNDLGKAIVSYKYKDANGEVQNVDSTNGYFNLPEGLLAKVYPTFYFE